MNDLSGREWAQASRSVETYPDVRSEKQRLHGAAFPQSLAEQQVAIYTKAGETVLDPFVGVGTTMDACLTLGRRGIGIDLNPEFLAHAQADLQQADQEAFQLIQGDARGLTKWIADDSVDFVLTSPPYGSLLKNVKGAFAYKWQEHSHLDAISNPEPYSHRTEDLGNMDYGPFLEALGSTLKETYQVLKPRGYAVWVVKDFRSLKEGVPYVNLHSDVIAQGQQAGFTLWDIRVYDQTKFRPLVCLGYPSKNFYLNLGHSYLLVLRKV
ncbi:MAG TPA: DNA methyltransferase [Solirubrobacterales bacterium]|nr:DNA methyltransferase [Solirubrobacterales bacterium]